MAASLSNLILLETFNLNLNENFLNHKNILQTLSESLGKMKKLKANQPIIRLCQNNLSDKLKKDFLDMLKNNIKNINLSKILLEEKKKEENV